MGLLDSLHVRNPQVGDPSEQFDRTNIESGILQARQAISEALRRNNPLLSGNTHLAIALWVSRPTVQLPLTENLVNFTPIGSGNLAFLPKTMIKIYFRVPVVHSNLSLPNNFRADTDRLSLLKPEEQDNLLIACHPYLYADFEKFSNINTGDELEVRFDDNTYTSAKIVKVEKKSINTMGSKIVDFTSSIIDLFNDAAETAILGTQVDKKYTNVIYELEDKLNPVGQIIETTGWPMISSVVEAEYKKWKYGALKETNSGAYAYLKEYWDNIGIAEWTPSGTPWSAAFISFVLKGSGFPGSSSHRSYTRKIIEKDTPWAAYSISKNKGKIKVGLGDVVVAPRGSGTEKEYGNTHGDVVYKIEEAGSGFKAFTAGGNLGNTAKDGTPLMLDGDHNLLNAGKYVVILKYGNLKNGA
jgi:hypothetical protein